MVGFMPSSIYIGQQARALLGDQKWACQSALRHESCGHHTCIIDLPQNAMDAHSTSVLSVKALSCPVLHKYQPRRSMTGIYSFRLPCRYPWPNYHRPILQARSLIFHHKTTWRSLVISKWHAFAGSVNLLAKWLNCISIPDGLAPSSTRIPLRTSLSIAVMIPMKMMIAPRRSLNGSLMPLMIQEALRHPKLKSAATRTKAVLRVLVLPSRLSTITGALDSIGSNPILPRRRIYPCLLTITTPWLPLIPWSPPHRWT